MAQLTTLHLTALPGVPYSFTAKTPAATGEHTGTFTTLHLTALPGGVYSFTAKTAVEVSTGDGTKAGQFFTPVVAADFLITDVTGSIFKPIAAADWFKIDRPAE